jgi:hypothetical protein
MKKPPDTPEFARFSKAMGTIMGVSKAAARVREEKEKRERPFTRMPSGPRPKSDIAPCPK